MNNRILFAAITFLFLSGCATSQKIVIPSYSAPDEMGKIEQLKHGSVSDKGSYLSFAINPEINRFPAALSKNDVEFLARNLVNQTMAQITETRFISIEPIYEMSLVKLDTEILDFKYQEKDNKRTAYLKTSFTLSKGANPILVKTYDEKEYRYSKTPEKLPSKQELISILAKSVVAKFIADISPTETNQLRTFLSLPSDLSQVYKSAKRGQYQTAINDMLSFRGNKDMAYYYNLAILYEALAGTNESLEFADKASTAYNTAYEKGGNSNKTVSDAKSRFDQFYRLLKLLKSQQDNNQILEQNINQQFSR